MTTKPMTTKSMTTKPMTTKPMTTKPMTTEPMTTEQINIAIAEACGWPYEPDDFPWLEHIPEYCNDLNAMHEAEHWLYNSDFYKYTEYLDALFEACSSAYKMAAYRESATARQRAEAFLKTLGKWKEQTNDN